MSDESAQAEVFKLRERARLKYGGTTSTWTVLNEIKRLVQKFEVAELVSVETRGLSAVLMYMPSMKVYGKLRTLSQVRNVANREFDDLLTQIVNAVNDCGYKCCYSGDFAEIHRV